MCGRFTLHHGTDEIAARFGAQEVLFDSPPRYNITPQQPVAVVTSGHGSVTGQTLEAFQWGLVPFWARDPAIGNKMINARSETVAEKPAFKNALLRRRCLLPTDGFYEWDKAGGTRQPIHFRRRDGALFAFAGLWEEWQSPDGSPLRTCTILTTAANETVGRVHDRMPVILRPEQEAFWLDTSAVKKPDVLLPLLKPYPDEAMEAFAVSRRVNIPVNDDPELIEPIDL